MAKLPNARQSNSAKSGASRSPEGLLDVFVTGGVTFGPLVTPSTDSNAVGVAVAPSIDWDGFTVEVALDVAEAVVVGLALGLGLGLFDGLELALGLGLGVASTTRISDVQGLLAPLLLASPL